MRRLMIASLVGAITLLIAVTGCKGSDSTSDTQSPGDRLAKAKQSFDDADYIGFTLSTEQLPSDLEGLLSAKGTGTHDPAFTGEVKIQAAFDITAPVIAVDGKVYAKLPFSPYSEIDPAKYGAPNPADLMGGDNGISSLFTATESPKTGDSTRDGETVLTEIDGTLAGKAVQGVFPSAGTADFDVTYTLTDANSIDKVKITGPFYDGYDDVTYTIDLDLAAEPVDINAP
ncbi:MAG: LppX_LprAFG lipoprotein [Nocardioidaceae bacterium]